MRARLHVAHDRLGFYEEESHRVCDPRPSAQLQPATLDWIGRTEDTLRRHRLFSIVSVEVAEDVPGEQRACHLELTAKTDSAAYSILGDGLTGLTAQRADSPVTACLRGTPVVTDTVAVNDTGGSVRLQRNVRSFFQGNRFLLEALARHVVERVPHGPVVDLYAGVGLFGLALAAAGSPHVVLVEGSPLSGSDLQINAEAFVPRATVYRGSVEGFLRSARTSSDATFIVDPPRTGLSKEAAAAILARAPQRVIYVSCDVATLARDTRTFVNAGYELTEVTAFDLFPNTAHVETVAVLAKSI
jgi:tRNA/tmRNA/rRNA uracil-C5-methylase (TrmA/RlmC/RlmD family)